jgi:hypothetical protein
MIQFEHKEFFWAFLLIAVFVLLLSILTDGSERHGKNSEMVF